MNPDVVLKEMCSDKPEFLAELQLGNEIDFQSTLEAFRTSGLFSSTTCLGRAGVLRARYDDKSILIFKSRRVVINSVKDIKEARDIVAILVKIIGQASELKKRSKQPTDIN